MAGTDETRTWTLPERGERGEVFRLFAWAWDVEKAKLLVAEKAIEETVTLPVGPLANLLQRTEVRDDGTFLVGMIGVDRERAMSEAVSLKWPLIAVRAPFGSDEDGNASWITLVIDGWHRIYRADAEKRQRLGAYVLSAEEELAIRMPMPTWGAWDSLASEAGPDPEEE